jgi:hypothetical protein
MPTYHTYDPKKDKLEKGTLIRLAGRKGKLTNFLCENEVIWDDAPNFPASYPDLARFPALEIAHETPRISKRLKEEILKWFPAHGIVQKLSNEDRQSFHEWLDSLEETD